MHPFVSTELLYPLVVSALRREGAKEPGMCSCAQVEGSRSRVEGFCLRISCK